MLTDLDMVIKYFLHEQYWCNSQMVGLLFIAYFITLRN